MAMQESIYATDGSDSFLDGLYRDYRIGLCTYVRRTFGSGPPDPEDIVQEAFVRFARADSPQSIPNPKAFLMLTARHLVIDAHRKMARGKAALQGAALLAEDRHDHDAAALLSSREELARLAAIIDTLRPKQRVAFLMHRIDGLSFAEIGRRMNISQSGARLLVDQALAICVERTRK